MESTAGPVSSNDHVAPFAEISARTRCIDRVDWLGFGLATAIAFVGYWFTLPPDVTLEMSGLMSAGAMYAGVPHVPGYPAWVLYAWAFTELIPFSNIAWRVALSSAVASAVACGLVALIVSRCGALIFRRDSHSNISDRTEAKVRITCSVSAALVLAFSNVIWRNAVIADPEAFSLLLFVSIVACLFTWMIQSRTKRLALAFLCFGLLLTSNQELIVMFPGMLLAIMIGRSAVGRDLAFVLVPLVGLVTAFNQYALWIDFFLMPNNWLLLAFFGVLLAAVTLAVRARRLGTEWRAVLVCTPAFIFGYAFYLYVPLAAMTTPPVNWGYARTVEGFFHVVARNQYERVRPLECDPFIFLEKLVSWFATWGNDFGWLYVVAALLPFCYWRRADPQLRRWLGALVAIGFGVGPLLLAHLDPPVTELPFLITRMHYGAIYAVASIALGMGLTICCKWIAETSLMKSANSLATTASAP